MKAKARAICARADTGQVVDPNGSRLSLHFAGQLTFGLEANGIRNARLLAPLVILYPSRGKIQFTIIEGMPSLAHVGKKDADLTVFACPDRIVRLR